MTSVSNAVQKRLLVLLVANRSSLQIGLRAVSSTASRSKDETDVFAANSNKGEIDSDFDITPNIPDAEESMEKEANFRFGSFSSFDQKLWVFSANSFWNLGNMLSEYEMLVDSRKLELKRSTRS